MPVRATLRAGVLATVVLLSVALTCGCESAGGGRVAGLEAVPAGFALEVIAVTSHGARVEAVIMPQSGLFRIALDAETTPSEMLITVRTPETQLGYRAQTILEGKPRPLDMAFLESPLTFSGPYDLEGLEWEGCSCTAALREDEPGAEPGSYAARIDEMTGIVVWERQEWDAYRGTIEITRRIIPAASAETPSPDDVITYACADWERTLDEAGQSSFPVYGLDLPGLRLHSLSLGQEATGVRYSTDDQPGRIAAELAEYPEAEALKWPVDLLQGWQEVWSDDHAVPGWGHMVVRGGRGVYIRVYSWALEELGLSVAQVKSALAPIEAAAGGDPGAEPPHRVFDAPMPLPADFAQTLPSALEY